MLKVEPPCCNKKHVGVALATLFFSGSFAFSSLKCWGSQVRFWSSCHFYLHSSFKYHLLYF